MRQFRPPRHGTPDRDRHPLARGHGGCLDRTTSVAGSIAASVLEAGDWPIETTDGRSRHWLQARHNSARCLSFSPCSKVATRRSIRPSRPARAWSLCLLTLNSRPMPGSAPNRPAASGCGRHRRHRGLGLADTNGTTTGAWIIAPVPANSAGCGGWVERHRGVGPMSFVTPARSLPRSPWCPDRHRGVRAGTAVCRSFVSPGPFQTACTFSR